MPRAVSVEVMRESDAWTIANKIPSKELMHRAGEGIYNAGTWTGRLRLSAAAATMQVTAMW